MSERVEVGGRAEDVAPITTAFDEVIKKHTKNAQSKINHAFKVPELVRLLVQLTRFDHQYWYRTNLLNMKSLSDRIDSYGAVRFIYDISIRVQVTEVMLLYRRLLS